MCITRVIKYWQIACWRLVFYTFLLSTVKHSVCVFAVGTDILLSQTVAYYEPLYYSKSILSRAHSRARRSLDATNHRLYLDFKAYGRVFNLTLQRERSLFPHDLLIADNMEGFSPFNFYEGSDLNEPSSYVHGFIHDGIFEGRVYCNDGNGYHIETSKQYGDLNHEKVHSVIYNVKDIIHRKPYLCGSISTQYQMQVNGANDIQKQTINSSMINTSEISMINTGYITYKGMKDGRTRNKRAAETTSIHRKRKRRAVDGRRKLVCEMHIRADPTFVKYANNDKERAMYLMSQHVKTATNMFRKTDFDGRGGPEGYTLAIRKIGTIDTTGCTGNSSSRNCKFAGDHIGAAKYLDLVSTDDHSKFCLSYVFTHRNFDEGILGLAFTGTHDDSDLPAQGICAGNKHIDGVTKTFNTGIVSNTVYGEVMSAKVTANAFAHALAHSFGAKHDPKDDPKCSPGGKRGNFLMYSQAQYGTAKNNRKLSACSKSAILKNLRINSGKCFKPSGNPICGNRIVEPGEDCDCGYRDDESCRKDPCCNGASPGGYYGCKFSPKARNLPPVKRCSPSNGFCCNPDTCQPYSNNTRTCPRSDECETTSLCVDTSYKCQKPKKVRETTPTFCNKRNNICVNGKCTGSPCLLNEVNQVDCQCTDAENACRLCCQHGSNSSSCSVFQLKGTTWTRPVGSPCNQFEGRCNRLHKCQNVNEEKIMERLTNWLFRTPGLNIYKWARENWWASVLILLAIILFMIAFVWTCQQFVPSDSTKNRKTGRPFLCVNRNPDNIHSSPGSQSNTSSRPYVRTPSEEPPLYEDSPPGYNTAVRDSCNIRYPPSYELEIMR